RGPLSGVSGMRRNDRRKLARYARTVVENAAPKAAAAALVMAETNGSPPLPQTVRSSPRNETGVRIATRRALATDKRVSESGTAKLVPRSTSSKTARGNRARKDMRPNATEGSSANEI